jgi:uncharacterized protein
MVQVELSKIIIDEKSHDQVIVLREKNGPRQIPIMIGSVEASSIQMRISGVESPRPLTHDLLVLLIKGLGAEAECVLIDDFVEGTYFAKIRLKKESGDVVLVDARPSDAVSLSVRMKLPIYVEEDVFHKTVAGG